ncbi:MAG TPA: hypothetical protein VHT75_00795 [Acidimicrobiales bacterium]|jgi:hypothetical protein|nr:hypothetical protein [Acidimicrobiales bacterium]
MTAVEHRRVPPIAEMAMASMALVIIGGIFMASYIPRRPPLALPTVLLVASSAVMVSALLMLRRLKDFAWSTFYRVAKWALVAYLVSAGLIEFAFVKDQTRGGPLVVVTLMLLIFAVNVPLIIGFTTARFEDRLHIG